MATSLSFYIFSMFFTVRAARLAFPFDCGYLGLLGLISNPHSLAKCVQSALSKGSPLPYQTFSGMPCLGNIAFRALITLVAVSFFLNATTSMEHEE